MKLDGLITVWKMKKQFCFSLTFLLCASFCCSQDMEDADAFSIKEIFETTFEEGQAYDWLSFLTQKIGGRLAGSPQAAAAVEFTRQVMDTLGFDRVWLQDVEVPHWVRGDQEIVRIIQSDVLGTQDLRSLALGNSVGTGPNGLSAEVLEVKSIDELKALGSALVKGKIVFFNRAMDPKRINTFSAYGGSVDQRGAGPIEAAKLGAVAAIVRSMTTSNDDVPHTGATRIDPDGHNIPAVAISTNDANLLSSVIAQAKTRIYIRTTCQMLKPAPSHNVIGEIRGSEFPDEIILVGGHLDSWDVGQGAHDDGAGCMQSIQVIHTLKKIGYQPKRTIRCVMFMNEENGLFGGRKYARVSNEKNEFHLAAIESDGGGFTPRGFGCSAVPEKFEGFFQSLSAHWKYLEPYGLSLNAGGSGADINPLRPQGGLLMGLRPDSQRYFYYHHTEEDTFDKVNQRELEMGAAAMTAVVFLIDKYGLNETE